MPSSFSLRPPSTEYSSKGKESKHFFILSFSSREIKVNFNCIHRSFAINPTISLVAGLWENVYYMVFSNVWVAVWLLVLQFAAGAAFCIRTQSHVRSRVKPPPKQHQQQWKKVFGERWSPLSAVHLYITDNRHHRHHQPLVEPISSKQHHRHSDRSTDGPISLITYNIMIEICVSSHKLYNYFRNLFLCGWDSWQNVRRAADGERMGHEAREERKSCDPIFFGCFSIRCWEDHAWLDRHGMVIASSEGT